MSPFDKSAAADRLADEVAALVTNHHLDSRSAAADALLDYRDPPRTERSDRLATLEAENTALKAQHARLREQVETLGAEAVMIDTFFDGGDRDTWACGWKASIRAVLALLAEPAEERTGPPRSWHYVAEPGELDGIGLGVALEVAAYCRDAEPRGRRCHIGAWVPGRGLKISVQAHVPIAAIYAYRPAEDPPATPPPPEN